MSASPFSGKDAAEFLRRERARIVGVVACAGDRERAEEIADEGVLALADEVHKRRAERKAKGRR